MAGLHFPITADNSNFMTAIHEVTTSVRDASRQIEADGGNIDKVISRIKTGLASIGAGWGFKEIAGAVANARGEFQQLDVAFKTMLGSEEKAATLMSQLVRTAAITPFDLQGVANGAKQLLAYGVSADEVNKRLTQLGNIASGLSIPLNDLVYLYGTTITQGKMFTQDLRQFQGRGIPIADELAKQFGVAKEKVGELVTAGKVGSKEFIAAIDAMTGPGSKFGGLMKEQSKTITGQISNIEDAFDTMLNEIGKSQQGLITGTLDVTSTLIENWQTVLAVLGDIAAAYGVEKAILAGSSAIAASSYAAELKELTALLPVKQQSINLDVQEAVAKGKITTATAEKVIAMRAEVKEYMDSLVASKAAAVAEAQLAAQKYRTALQQSIASKATVAAKREELIASGEICGAYISENAIKEMGIVTEKSKAASIQSTIAKQEYHAAVTKKNIATEALDTATTNANTAAQTLNARSTNILTVAKEGLVKTTRKLYATMMAHPYALITAAAFALGIGIYKLATYQTDYEKSTAAANKAAKEQESSMREEQKSLNELKVKLEGAKKGSKEWKAAKESIVSQFGKYFKGLDSEIEKTGNLTSSYDRLTKAIRLSAAARAMESYRNDNDLSDDIDKSQEAIRKSLTSRKLMKVDAQGNLVKGKNGGYEYVRIGGPLLESIMQKVYESYEKEGDLSKLSAKELAYLNQTGQLTKIDGTKSLYQKTVNKAKARKSGEEIIAQRYGTTVDEIDGRVLEDDKENSKNLQVAYTEASKNYKAAQKKVEDMKKNRSAYTQKEWEAAQEELKTAKDAYEKAGGETKTKKASGPTADQIESKQTEAHQKLIDLMKQQAEEHLKLQQDFEYQQWQNRIDLMDEGEAKIIAQMELDHKKEQTSLEEQKKQAIQAEIARQKALFDAREDEKAAGNKKYAKQVFDPTTIYDPDNKVIDPEIQKVIDRYDSLNADLLAKQQKAEADRLQAAKESFNAYLQEFGTYQQKREAIATDYDTRIAAAANAGERMTLEAQKNKALSDLDYQQWIDSEEIALAFGDISNLSRQTISRLIEDMEKYREKVVATFDPEKIEKYNEALNNLRMADVENSFSAFGSMVPEYFTKRLAIQKQINDEAKIGLELIQRQNELNIRTEAKKGAIKIQAKSSGYNITDEDLADPNRIQQIADKISVSAANGDLFAAALHSALLELLKLNGEATELANATQKWDGNFSHLKETLANLEGEAKFKAIAEAVGNAAGLIGNLAGQASEMADAIGAEGLGEALGYLGDAMGSVQNIASGFAQGGIVGGIAAAAGEVMNWVTKLAMAGDARHQKNIERIQERIDALQKSYDRLGESAEKAYSTDASEMIDQQNTLLKQQQILIRQQMAEEEAKKKTDKDKIKEYQEQLEEIDALLAENADKAKEAIIGKDIKSAIDEFASLYAEAWDDGTDAAQKSMQAVKSIISSALTELLKKNIQPAAQNFYDTLAKAMEDGILTDAELANLDAIKAQIDALAAAGEEQYKKIQERYKDLDELREELTDISFDSVRDNFKSLLSDMESSTADFTESFTDMLRNALIDGLMDNKYDALLKEWYAEFAEAMNDQKLTDEERERLRQQYQSIIDQSIADRNAINAIVGGGAYSQQASSGEAWGMTQETGEELNGRFTAMVELEATNNVLVSDGNAIAREILVTLRSMSGLSMTVTGNGDNQTLLAIKDMIFLSTGYLEDIAKYSKLLAVISSDVADMKEKVKDI